MKVLGVTGRPQRLLNIEIRNVYTVSLELYTLWTLIQLSQTPQSSCRKKKYINMTHFRLQCF
jgi:hypothetical protein